MNPTSIIIDGTTYIPSDQATPSPVQIVIGQRGWVWVGRTSTEDEQVTITDARCIRRWGTTGGLAQLANDGPQTGTTLEPACTVRLHQLTVVATIDCDPAKW
jgi:hypothetical protein